MKIKKDGITYSLGEGIVPFDEARVMMPVSEAEYSFFRNESKKQMGRHLKNPIYLRNAFQFCFGGFYQAVHGILSMYSIERDLEITRDLKEYLEKNDSLNFYFIRTYRIQRYRTSYDRLRVVARAWQDGYNNPPTALNIKPETYHFEPGDFITVRGNELDEEGYYDIEGYCHLRNENVVVRIGSGVWPRHLKRLHPVVFKTHQLRTKRYGK